MIDADTFLDRRQERRMRDEDKALARMDRQWTAAEALVGELCREGKTVYYINQLDRRGRYTGRTVEFGASFSRAVEYLVRNRYI